MMRTFGRISNLRFRGFAVIAVSCAAIICESTLAARIGDVTHLQGRRVNKLVGLGLVTGLPGTGDGGKFAPAIRSLAAFLTEFSNPILSLDELKNAKL